MASRTICRCTLRHAVDSTWDLSAALSTTMRRDARRRRLREAQRHHAAIGCADDGVQRRRPEVLDDVTQARAPDRKQLSGGNSRPACGAELPPRPPR